MITRSILFGVTVLFGCTEVDENNTDCVPGDVRSCPCSVDAVLGEQECTADGKSWGDCDCGSGDSDIDSDVDTDSDTDTEIVECESSDECDPNERCIEGVCLDQPATCGGQATDCPVGGNDEVECFEKGGYWKCSTVPPEQCWCECESADGGCPCWHSDHCQGQCSVDDADINNCVGKLVQPISSSFRVLLATLDAA